MGSISIMVMVQHIRQQLLMSVVCNVCMYVLYTYGCERVRVHGDERMLNGTFPYGSGVKKFIQSLIYCSQCTFVPGNNGQ